MPPFDFEASLAEFRKLAIPLIKAPSDLARYEEIIRRVAPRLVVETGTGYGGSQAWFAERVESVFTVDNVPERAVVAFAPNVVSYAGSSLDRSWLARLELHHGRAGIVSLDSDHSTAHVRRELDAYAPLVAPGGYLVVEDTIFHYYESERIAQGDPLAAVEEWLPEHPEFSVATDIEEMFSDTQMPGGWLRRAA